jgi:hypothetical protein
MKSSWITDIAWKDGTLTVYSKHGTLTHSNVPERIYKAFQQAQSGGEFYNLIVKKSYPAA